MIKPHRILWGEGMFLRPQHFQQQAIHTEHRLAEVLHSTRLYTWGLRRIDLDPDALKSGVVRLGSLSLVFPDGSSLTAPELAPLPMERDLNVIPQLGLESVLYACLPFLNAYGGNSAEHLPGTARPCRYLSERIALPDLYTEALEAEITTLHPHVQLLVEEENRDGYLSVPIARLTKNAAGNWQADEHYIPPLMRIGASATLTRMLKRLLDILMVKHQSLAALHRERSKNFAEFGTSDIASFWLLHTVNRNFPVMSHFCREPDTSPEALYLVLAQMAGELLTFSTAHTLSDVPPYRHLDATALFEQLDTLIRELLETVISARYAMITLTCPKPSFLIGRLDSERLTEGVDYYLSVQSELPTAEVIESVPSKLKIGAPDDVEKILNSALPGVRLAHAAQTPSALPVRVGNHYFAFEPHGQIFERMQKAHSVCIYVPQTLSEMKLELIAVFR